MNFKNMLKGLLSEEQADKYYKLVEYNDHMQSDYDAERMSETEEEFCSYVQKELSGQNKDYYKNNVPLTFEYLKNHNEACRELLHMPVSAREYKNLADMIRQARRTYQDMKGDTLLVVRMSTIMDYAETLLADDPLYNAMHDMEKQLKK